MLQQTQVDTVVDYFNNFIINFPTLPELANASEDEVLASWAGLGYYSRARNLHKSAKIILSEYRGVVPNRYSELMALPGIGESTAGAILSLAYNQSRPILDLSVCLASPIARNVQFPETAKQTSITIRRPFLKKTQKKLGLKDRLHF